MITLVQRMRDRLGNSRWAPDRLDSPARAARML